MIRTVDLQNADAYLIAGMQHVGRMGYLGLRNLRDVYQPLETFLETRECPKSTTFVTVASMICPTWYRLSPASWISSQAFETESNTMVFLVYAEYADLHSLANAQEFLGVINTAPRQLGDMHQTIDSTRSTNTPKSHRLLTYP